MGSIARTPRQDGPGRFLGSIGFVGKLNKTKKAQKGNISGPKKTISDTPDWCRSEEMWLLNRFAVCLSAFVYGHVFCEIECLVWPNSRPGLVLYSFGHFDVGLALVYFGVFG